MNSAQRALVDRILDWSERGFVENVSTAAMVGVVTGGGIGGASSAFSNFEAAVIELARSLVTQAAEELNRERMALSRMLPEGAVSDVAELEIPGFFEHEKGPALTFMPAMEDRARKLFAQYRVDGAWSMIKLEPGDVRQARAFFDAWLRLAEGSRGEVELKPESEGEVTVYDRKYRFYCKPGDYRVHVDRHGEPWLVIEQGCNAVAALMDELIEAKSWLVEWKNANTELVSRVAQLQISQNERLSAFDLYRAGSKFTEARGTVERAETGLEKLRRNSAYAPGTAAPEDETPRGIRESLELLDRVGQPQGANVRKVSSYPTALLDGLRGELDRYRHLGAALFNWVHQHGAALDPKGSADTYGEGVRESKKQVRSLLERFNAREYVTASEEHFVQTLDERVAEFRRLYANESLEAFLAWSRARVSPAVRVAFEIAVEPRLREPAKAAPAPLDTMNRFLVTAHDGEVLVRKPLTFSVFSATEALQLASWLIAGADLADYDRPLETVIATVKAIQST